MRILKEEIKNMHIIGNGNSIPNNQIELTILSVQKWPGLGLGSSLGLGLGFRGVWLENY